MSIHEHSTAALADLTADGTLGKRAAEILSAARGLALDPDPAKRAWTDRDMLRVLGYSDMTAVRPRITELLSMGLLIEVDAVRDPVTGKTVRRCRAATDRDNDTTTATPTSPNHANST